MAKRLSLVQDVEAHAMLSLLHIDGPHIVLFAQAIRQCRNGIVQRRQIWIVAEIDDALLDLTRKRAEGRTIILDALVIIHMVKLDVGDDGIIRVISEEMALIFA